MTKNFILSYSARDELTHGQTVMKRLKWVLPCRAVAKSLFCKVAEEQVFFFHDTVTDTVRNQAAQTSNGWKKLYHKVHTCSYIKL